MRLAVRFETGAQQHLWLNTSVYIAKTWEPVTLRRGVSRAVTLSPMAHSATRITPAAASSARSTARRTQSACRTDRHDEPSSPIADTPTSFAGQTIRATSRLCTADDRYRWVNEIAGNWRRAVADGRVRSRR